MTYYDKEFAKIENDQVDLQLIGLNGSTRWLAVTPEQVKAILAILNKDELK